MKKLDLLVVGELNCDLILDKLQEFPKLGKEQLSDSMSLTLGSSSAIFASNASALGLKTAFTGKLGQDMLGDLVMSSLKKRKVDTSRISRQHRYNTGISVHLNFNADRAILTYKGPMDDFRFSDLDWNFIKTARHLHLSSYYLQKGLQPGCPALFKKAKTLGLSTSLDTNWDPEDKWGNKIYKVLPYVDIFMPNENEALRLARASSLKHAMAILSRYAGMVVVKCGKKGALVQQGHKTYHHPGIRVKAVDPVGAGDSFDAGFITKFLKGGSLEECLIFGNVCGAFSTTCPGGTAAFDNISKFWSFAKNHTR